MLSHVLFHGVREIEDLGVYLGYEADHFVVNVLEGFWGFAVGIHLTVYTTMNHDTDDISASSSEELKSGKVVLERMQTHANGHPR